MHWTDRENTDLAPKIHYRHGGLPRSLGWYSTIIITALLYYTLYYIYGRRIAHGNPSLLRMGLLWVSKGFELWFL
jgi:hypothetical protein